MVETLNFLARGGPRRRRRVRRGLVGAPAPDTAADAKKAAPKHSQHERR